MAADRGAVGTDGFTVQQTPFGELITLRPRRVLFFAFLPLWLAAFTYILGSMLVPWLRDPNLPFVLVIAPFLAAWLTLALFLLWLIVGVQTIRIDLSELEIANRVLWLRRRRSYLVAKITNLDRSSTWASQRSYQIISGSGSLKFRYGGKTVQFAPTDDEGDTQMILERLVRRLPRNAVCPAIAAELLDRRRAGARG